MLFLSTVVLVLNDFSCHEFSFISHLKRGERERRGGGEREKIFATSDEVLQCGVNALLDKLWWSHAHIRLNSTHFRTRLSKDIEKFRSRKCPVRTCDAIIGWSRPRRHIESPAILPVDYVALSRTLIHVIFPSLFCNYEFDFHSLTLFLSIVFLILLTSDSYSMCIAVLLYYYLSLYARI